MKWFIWSIRAWFCKHEWEYEESEFSTYHTDYNFTTSRMRVSATCKHCGWHRKYNKF
jgi:RNase P subunit RPR2